MVFTENTRQRWSKTYDAVGNIAFETQGIDEITNPEIVSMTIYFSVTF